MKTNSGRHRPSTSDVEVTNVSVHGFWLLIGDKERFVPFRTFPWFREASIKALTNVRLAAPHHLHWTDLDVDLAVDSLDHPECYPLVSRACARCSVLRNPWTGATRKKTRSGNRKLPASSVRRPTTSG